MPKEKKPRFYWKGKIVTEKVYRARINQQKAGRNVRSIYGTKNLQRQHNLEIKESTSSKYVDLKEEGSKLFNVETIAHQLICKNCDNVLSLLDTTQSIATGLGTTYYVNCRKCEHSNDVLTDKQHSVPGSQKMIFNCNTKAVIGTLNGGGGYTALNKVLTSLGVSPLNWSTYKTHEKEVGHVVEKMVEESCMNATKEERQLTIENSEKLKKLL